MRILHVYSGNLFGGVERMLISLTMLEASTEHSFALCFEGKLSRTLRERGATVRILPAARLRAPVSILRTRSGLKKLLAGQRYDAVVCHGIWVYCIYAPVVAAARYASVFYLHDIPEPRNLYYRWGWRKPPRLCVANSEYTAGLVGQLRPRVPVEIVHPLVPPSPSPDPERIRALRAEFGAEPEHIVVLQAGRFEAWKGHANLFGALRDLCARPDWRCWIAGAPQRPKEEEYERELRAMIQAFGIADRVRFIGHRSDIETVLAACDIYCQPNQTPEPFGMLFVEALYAGKPVLGSALGGSLEIVTPDCGLLCAPDPGEIRVALTRLLEDGQLRARMSAAGPARAARLCGNETFTTRFRDAVQRLVTSYRSVG